MSQPLLSTVKRCHARLRDDEHVYMVLLAAIVGVGGGFAAVGFRKLIGAGHVVAWTHSWRELDYSLDFIRSLPWWWTVSVPAIGGLLCALIVYYFAREAKGHGVPEVMEAVALRSGRIRPRVVLAKMFASAISISSGGSVGREGPIVQIGAAFGSTVGQWLGLDERRMRTLVGCGAAAGIAATFNAPVAGALFAVEIILADFAVLQFSPIVISSVIATVIGRVYLESTPAFKVSEHLYKLESGSELFAYAVLGIIAGLVALLFVKVLYRSEDLWDAIPVWPPARALMGGAIVGVIALWYPQIFGVGYEGIREALAGQIGWQLLASLVLIKIVAVSITIGSGGSGGVFAPSLFIGAMTGGAVGTAVNAIWPAATAGPGTYALVGMVAVVGATTHAPITAIVIIFELTDDYAIMLPLMISCILATLVAMRLQRASIYTKKLLRRGVDIHKGQDVNVVRHLLVRDQMRTDAATVPPGATMMETVAALVRHPGATLFVVDDDRRLLGIITAHQRRTVLTDPQSFEALLIAQDIMQETGFPSVTPDDTLADVMRRLARYRGEVPVVDNGRLVGVIWPEDVLERYNVELIKRDMASGMASSISGGSHAAPFTVADNTSLIEITVPRAFVGRSVGSLAIRKRFDASILMVRQKGAAGAEVVNAVPSADYVFRHDDVMLVMGPNEQLRRLEHGG